MKRYPKILCTGTSLYHVLNFFLCVYNLSRNSSLLTSKSHPFLLISLLFTLLYFPFPCGFYSVIMLYWICILKWREESCTYLTRICKHCWSRKHPVEIEEITGASTADESHGVGWKLLLFLQFLLDAFRSSYVYKCESGRCYSLPSF